MTTHGLQTLCNGPETQTQWKSEIVIGSWRTFIGDYVRFMEDLHWRLCWVLGGYISVHGGYIPVHEGYILVHGGYIVDHVGYMRILAVICHRVGSRETIMNLNIILFAFIKQIFQSKLAVYSKQEIRNVMKWQLQKNISEGVLPLQVLCEVEGFCPGEI